MKKNLTVPFLGIIFLFLVSACIRDTDFTQADDIVLTPVVELDLIYFDLTARDFFDTINGTPVFTLSDTTEIRFLNDQEISESLKRAEFYFKFTNSIPRAFQADFQFLSEENDTTYTTQTTVSQGNSSNSVITELIENVEGDDIVQLTMASKVVVSVTIPSWNESLAGELNLKSKTTYFLEF